MSDPAPPPHAGADPDPAFAFNGPGLAHALDLLAKDAWGAAAELPDRLPERGEGEYAALDRLAPSVLGGAARLDRPDAFAHMDPPTPWIAWALALWNARLNQNLLHPATAPFARAAEERVVAWLAPYFGMGGGHMTGDSTLANLTALWAAREVAGVRRVVASAAAHVSVAKAARILGLPFEAVPADAEQRLDPGRLGDISDAALVLTLGTTAAGAIDPLALAGRAAWTHADAAWAGPLRLSPRYRDRLKGIEAADSIAVSAHKLLFQPKGSALVLFRDPARVNRAIGSDAAYLAAPNVGLEGSRGASATILLATLLAWGRAGIAERVERAIANAERVAARVAASRDLRLFAPPETGVVLFREKNHAVDWLAQRLLPTSASLADIAGEPWIRMVAANPAVRIGAVLAKIGLA